MSERVVQDEVSMSEWVGQGVDICEGGTGVTLIELGVSKRDQRMDMCEGRVGGEGLGERVGQEEVCLGGWNWRRWIWK